jgi:hypothetical protein
MPKYRNIEVHCLGNEGWKRVTTATKLLESTAVLTRKREPCNKVYSIRYGQTGFKERHNTESSQTSVEAGSNTPTVTLRVVGGDEKGTLKSETVKYCRKSQGTRTRERLRWQGPAAHTKDRPVLSSERTPHGNKNVTVKRK